MHNVQTLPQISLENIPTLREGKVVFAFCPICDRAEQTRDNGRGLEQTTEDSVAKIKTHLRIIHRSR